MAVKYSTSLLEQFEKAGLNGEYEKIVQLKSFAELKLSVLQFVSFAVLQFVSFAVSKNKFRNTPSVATFLAMTF